MLKIEDTDRRILAFIVAEYTLASEPRNGNVIRWVLYDKVHRWFEPEYEVNWSLWRLMEKDYIRKEGPAFYGSHNASDGDMYVPTTKGMIELWTPTTESI